MSFACRLLGLVAVVGFLLVAFTPAFGPTFRRVGTERALEPAAAIVTLGAGASADGTLSPRSLSRAVYAVRLYRRGLAPVLVLLGPSRAGGPDEAGLRGQLARELGVPPEAILTDPGGRTTDEEAARTKALLAPRGVRRILLVTGSYHMPRAERLFADAGFEVMPAPVKEGVSSGDRPGDRIGFAETLVVEFVARQYYRLWGSR